MVRVAAEGATGGLVDPGCGSEGAMTYLLSKSAGLVTLLVPGVITGTALVLLLPEPDPL